MTPEGAVKKNVKKILDRWQTVCYFMPVSGGFGKHGIPDFIVCINGRFLGIECKAGKGEMTPLQEKFFEKVGLAGGDCMVVNEKNIDVLEVFLAAVHSKGR